MWRQCRAWHAADTRRISPMLIAGPNLTHRPHARRIAELRPGDVLRFDGRRRRRPAARGSTSPARRSRSARRRVLVALRARATPARAAAALIAEEGVALRGVAVRGEIRSTSVDPRARRPRDRAQRAGAARSGAGDWERYEDGDRRRALADHGVLVCSGSLPPGAPPDAYGRLVAIARARGRARGRRRDGRDARRARSTPAPDVVTPNLAEAEGLLHGRADETVEAAPRRAAARARRPRPSLRRARRARGRRHRGRRGRGGRRRRRGGAGSPRRA